MRIGPPQLRTIPIPKIQAASKSIRQDLKKNVDLAIDLNSKLRDVRVPIEQSALERQLKNVEREIDLRVYEFYDLTKEEIATVEKSTDW